MKKLVMMLVCMFAVHTMVMADGYRTFRARSALLRLAPCCFLRFYRQPCKRGSMGDTFPRGSRRPPLGR